MINDDVEKYLEYLSFQKGYSSNTVISYRRDIYKFLEYMEKENASFNDVDSILIRNFLLEETLDGISKRSSQRRLVALRRFYEWMLKEKKVKFNPFKIISSPKLDKTLPDFLHQEEIDELFVNNEKRTDFLALRDHALLELLYASGLRVSEIVNLTLDQVESQTRIIKVTGKGNKERMVPYSVECKKTLDKYIDECRKEIVEKNKLENDPKALFLNARGEKLTTRGVEYILKSIEKKIGMELDLHPHKMRHSFATHLLDEGVDLRVIQEILGHESLETTQVYTHISTSKMIESYQNYFPRAKKGDKQE